jgi:hypothetical protein
MPLYSDLEALQCPACSKYFTTTRGRNSYLLQAKSCKWYRREKLIDDVLVDNNAPVDLAFSNAEVQMEHNLGGDGLVNWQDDLSYSWDDSTWPDPSDDEDSGGLDLPLDEDVSRDEFRLLPQAGPGPHSEENRASQSRPAQSRTLDDGDDSRFIINHPTAGSILSTVRDRDGDIVMDDVASSDRDAPEFTPFNSELDWRIAEWAIKDSVGHSSFDRLLAIPGV